MLKPWLKPVQWCIPPEQSAAFVACMEDVLEVYTRPLDPARPQVCLDEKGLQLVADTRAPLPATAKQRAREDFEYGRAGAANVFMLYEPLAGVRHALVRERRTACDFAAVVKHLCDELYPAADQIVLVMDQLNTHSTASLYEAFTPAEARRLARKLEIHHSPKHGSWLNMAEVELSVLSRQCLRRRVPGQEVLAKEVAAWQAERNTTATKIDWRFTTADARIKLARLYPSTQP